MNIQNYEDFKQALQKTGFSMGGGNPEGIYAVIPWNWQQEPPYETPVRWHTGEAETDPWEWRIRILEEDTGIAYAKMFFKKSGYITREWYPYFLAARRKGRTLEEAYREGLVSQEAKRIFECIGEEACVPVHELKSLAGFGKEEKSRFERGLTELQTGLFLTIAGRKQKLSSKGEAFGWSSTVFCRTEHFWGNEVFQEAAGISPRQAEEAIEEQILFLNPQAESKKIKKFILG